MKQTLQQLKSKIETLNSFRYINFNWGQLNGTSPAPPVKFPCAIISLDEVKVQPCKRLYNPADAVNGAGAPCKLILQTSVQINTRRPVRSKNDAPDQALQLYDLANDVIQAVSNQPLAQGELSFFLTAINLSEPTQSTESLTLSFRTSK